jgi:hypothetical protein
MLCGRYIHVAGPYYRFFLIQVSNIIFKVCVPLFFLVHCLTKRSENWYDSILKEIYYLQSSSGIDDVRPDNITTFKFESNNTTFDGVRIRMTRKSFRDRDWLNL